jgi:hypothetical protein
MEMQPDIVLELVQTSVSRPVKVVPLADLAMIVRYAQAAVVVGVWHISAPGGLSEMSFTAAPICSPANSTLFSVVGFV